MSIHSALLKSDKHSYVDLLHSTQFEHLQTFYLCQVYFRKEFEAEHQTKIFGYKCQGQG